MNHEEKENEKATPKETDQGSNDFYQERIVNNNVKLIKSKLPYKNNEKPVPGTCITVFNIDYEVMEDDLFKEFSKIDDLKTIVLLTDPLHPEFNNRGIAYITYGNIYSADQSIKKLNHTLIGNRRIRIELAYDYDPKTKTRTKPKSIHSPSPDHKSKLIDDRFNPDDPHSRSSHHIRSRNVSLDYYSDYDYDIDDNFHHHSRHHRHLAPILDRPPIEYADPYLQIPHMRSQMLIPPDFHPHLPPPVSIDDEVENLSNELSILVELYRDALLTQNINDMKKKE